MEQNIILSFIDKEGNYLKETVIEKPNSYNSLISSIKENTSSNNINFELFKIENIKIPILSDNDFQKDCLQYYIIENNSEVDQSKINTSCDQSETSFYCPLCGKMNKKNNFKFCHDCNFFICLDCIQQNKNIETNLIKCPNCEENLSIENWKNMQNFVKNKNEEKILLNKIYENFIKLKNNQINELKNSIENMEKNKNYDDAAHSKSNNEILITLNISEEDINKKIYFLDNTDGDYYENGKQIIHHHDNLPEINSSNTDIYINDKKEKFSKYFIPKIGGSYQIKIIFSKKLTNIKYMFCGCKNITKIDLSLFDSQNATDMTAMFRNCDNLTSINFNSFNTYNITNMSDLFRNCFSLQSLDLSSFNTENVTNMYCLFFNCSSLQILDLSFFNTQNVKYMNHMFENCKSLEMINLTSFNTQSVCDMGYMFHGCQNLTKIDLSSFNNTNNLTNLFFMFSDCENLEEIDLTSFSMDNVNDMGSMFENCANLKKVNFSAINSGNLTDMSNMFFGCISLEEIDLSGFNMENVTDTENMFLLCDNLKLIKANENNFQKIIGNAPPNSKLSII